MIQRFRLICAIALLSLADTASAAIESSTVRYRDMVDPVHLGRVLNLDPGLVSRLHFRLRLVPLSASDDPSQLSVAVGKQTYRANRVGAIDMLLTADLYRQNPIVLVRGSLRGRFFTAQFRLQNCALGLEDGEFILDRCAGQDTVGHLIDQSLVPPS